MAAGSSDQTPYASTRMGKVSMAITPHTARHTFAVRYLYQTGDIFSLMKMLGHSDIKTTQVYLHIVEKLRDENMAKLKSLMPDE